MRWLLLFFALLFVTPQSVDAQTVVRKSELTVMHEDQLFYLHTVRRKETLYSIANAYNVTVKQISDRNPFVDVGIKIGQILLIPTVSEKTTQSADNKANTAQSTPVAKPQSMTPQPDATPQRQYIEPKRETEPLMPSLGGGAPSYDGGEFGDLEDEVLDSVSDGSVEEVVDFGPTKKIDRSKPIRIAMMLPFGGPHGDENFVDFYRGASLAFDELEQKGAHLIIDVISTSSSEKVVQKIIADGRLDQADMIIGPVYSGVFEIVAQYAARHRVPIISPLGSTGDANNAMVVEVAPLESSKWDKIKPLLLDPKSNVILVTSSIPSMTDSISLQQIQPYLPSNFKHIDYQGKVTRVDMLSGLLERDKNNVIVAPLINENLVENLLSRYSSINIAGRNDVTVIGMPRWARFLNMNLELFFKLSVQYPTTYFYDRMDERVRTFFSDYVTRYSSLPTLYSMRGYDVMMMFGGGIARDFEHVLTSIVDRTNTVLQVPYNFAQEDDIASKIVNRQWALVQYLPSFKIEVR